MMRHVATKLYCKTCRVYREKGQFKSTFKRQHQGHELTFIETEEAPAQ